jgi:hypothetical protein
MYPNPYFIAVLVVVIILKKLNGTVSHTDDNSVYLFVLFTRSGKSRKAEETDKAGGDTGPDSPKIKTEEKKPEFGNGEGANGPVGSGEDGEKKGDTEDDENIVTLDGIQLLFDIEAAELIPLIIRYGQFFFVFFNFLITTLAFVENDIKSMQNCFSLEHCSVQNEVMNVIIICCYLLYLDTFQQLLGSGYSCVVAQS